MKKQVVLFFLSLLLSGLSVACFAQDEEQPQPRPVPEVPKWVSDKGYWVVEGNVHTPKHNVVFFYNMDGVLVYKETVDGMKLKLKRKKVLMRMKEVLEQSVTAWELKRTANENETLLAVALKR